MGLTIKIKSERRKLSLPSHRAEHVPNTLVNIYANYGMKTFGWREFNYAVTGASSARSNVMERMLKYGLIERTSTPGPRGGKTWRITDKGERFIKERLS